MRDIVCNDVFVCSGSDGRHAGGDLLEGENGDRGGERAHRVGAAPRAAVRAPRPAPPSATRAIRATRPLVPYLRTCLTHPSAPRAAATSPSPDSRTQLQNAPHTPYEITTLRTSYIIFATCEK